MIYVGIDDTDMPDTPGTNQLARALAAIIEPEYRCRLILRHQLLFDPRVPCTSKNGSASLVLEPLSAPADLAALAERLRDEMLRRFVAGSDPGLCVTARLPCGDAAAEPVAPPG